MKSSPAIWLTGAVALSIGLLFLLAYVESPEPDNPASGNAFPATARSKAASGITPRDGAGVQGPAGSR